VANGTWFVLSLGIILFINLFASDICGIAYGTWSKVRPAELAGVERFTEPRLAPLLLYDDPLNPASPSNGRAYVTYVNEGVALLRKCSGTGERILTMDVSNPFPFALNSTPPLGGMAVSSYNVAFSDSVRPSD
jgi:hypothetical protein